MTGHQLAAILRAAADFWLWDGVTGEDSCKNEPNTRYYSCDACLAEVQGIYSQYLPCRRFLLALGLHDFGLFNAFDDVDPEHRQGARFLWLDFAALVADDIGDGLVDDWPLAKEVTA